MGGAKQKDMRRGEQGIARGLPKGSFARARSNSGSSPGLEGLRTNSATQIQKNNVWQLPQQTMGNAKTAKVAKARNLSAASLREERKTKPHLMCGSGWHAFGMNCETRDRLRHR